MGTPRINRAAEQGERTRAKIEAGALAAGAKGIKTRELAPMLGVSAHCIDFQLRSMKTVWKVQTKHSRNARIFHVDFKAEADAYVKAADGDGKRPRGPSVSTQANAELILRRAGERGMNVKEMSAAIGLHRITCGHMLKLMCKQGLANFELDKRDGKSLPFRYWAAGIPTIKQPETQKAKAATKKYECDKVRKSAPVVIAKSKTSGEPIITASTKITVCPSGKDHRFTVRSPQQCFSALPPGAYLPDDTWAARAYT